MEKVRQTKDHNPPEQNGNCFRAALASILECDISDFPPFEEMTDVNWSYYFSVWMWLKGWKSYWIRDPSGGLPDGVEYGLAHMRVFDAGPFGGEEFGHAVVWDGESVVWDPAPSDQYMEGPSVVEVYRKRGAPLDLFSPRPGGYRFAPRNAKRYRATPRLW